MKVGRFDYKTEKFRKDTKITVRGCAMRSDKYFGGYGQKTDLFLLNLRVSELTTFLF